MSRFFAMLWQPIRPFEFTAPVFDRLKYRWLAFKPLSTLIFGLPGLRRWLTRRVINERIVELPFVLGNLPPLPAKILDVGACESPLSLMLASLGYWVTALDLRPYPFDHPNLTVVVSDITNSQGANRFDLIVCLSVLEHIGLPVYGSRAISDGDAQAIKQIYHLLRPGGHLLLTVPVARQFRLRPAWREYDVSALKRLLRLFKSVELKVGLKNARQQWQIADQLPRDFSPTDELVDAVALIKATK